MAHSIGPAFEDGYNSKLVTRQALIPDLMELRKRYARHPSAFETEPTLSLRKDRFPNSKRQ